MKRIVEFFIVLVLSAVVYSAGAQNEQNEQKNQNDQNTLRQVVDRNTYGDNWFISLGGNANLLGGEQDSYLSLGKRLGFGGALTAGKWFNQNFGAQIQVMGGALRGFNRNGNPGGNFTYNKDGFAYFVYKKDIVQDHRDYPVGGPFSYDANGNVLSPYSAITAKGWRGFKQNFNYGTATIDLIANLTNLFRGYDTGHNPIDVIGFAGLGAIHAFNNNVTTPDFWWGVAKVGGRINFNITNKIAIYLEGQANITDKEFDGYVGTSSADGVVNLGLGIQYTFNKKFTSLTQIAQLTADEIDKLNKKINDTRYLLENQQDILERQQDLLDRLQKCCDENKKPVITQVVETSACLPEYIRFGLDSYKIEPSELSKIAEVADYLKQNTNSKLLIVGYADRKTGNPKYNLNLSQKRVDAVAAELKRLGINPNRIISEWKGDKEQPFPQNEWNRVVVMVERK